MDPIYTYKDKIHEAIALVPSMSSTNKIEAINYWNTIATQMATILDNEESSKSSCESEHSNLLPPANQVGPHDLMIYEIHEELGPNSTEGEANSDCPPQTAQLRNASQRPVKIESRATDRENNPELATHCNQESANNTSLCAPTSDLNDEYVDLESDDANKTSFNTDVMPNTTLIDDDIVNLSTGRVYTDANNGQLVSGTTEDEVPSETIDYERAARQSADLTEVCQAIQDDRPDNESTRVIPFVPYQHEPNLDAGAYAPSDATSDRPQFRSLVDILFVNPMVTSTNNDAEFITCQISRAHAQQSPTTSAHDHESKCNICGKSGFSTKGNLNRHIRTHSGEKPFECGVCHSRFTEKKSLKIHERKHTGEKPYSCNLCDKEFSQTGALQTHMATHNEGRKFECSQCDKSFRQRSQLKIHELRHAGVKNLACTQCAAKFLTKGDFDRHFRIHTGERPFECPHCGKGFTRQQSLNDHVNRHTRKMSYTCRKCDVSFASSRGLLKHFEAKIHTEQEMSDDTVQTSGMTTRRA